MTESSHEFRMVLRGYDPAEVDSLVHELTEATAQARRQLDDLTAQVEKLEAEREHQGEAEPAVASFAHLGDRVARILTLADEEAEAIRQRVHDDPKSERDELSETVGRLRGEADRYAEQRRSDADTEAARVLEDARRTADDRIDSADRDAAARLQEAEAIYEDQRAKAAKAAADFETTLAVRRRGAEAEFTEQMSEAQHRLEELEQHIASSRSQAESAHEEAVREARRIVDEAQQQANAIIGDAKTTATRIRSESERELAAASQRRDSINAQLSNVRQMLATLTGGAALSLDAITGPVSEDSDEQVPETDDEEQAEKG